jgi:hypothetical protein
MTTSEEHWEKLQHYVPHDPLPRFHNVNNGSTHAGAEPPPLPQPGDPGPQPPPANLEPDDPISRQLQEIGDLAKKGINYQFATLALLAGYAAMFRHVRQALDHLTPGDLARMPNLRSELSEAVAEADRSINAQTVPAE